MTTSTDPLLQFFVWAHLKPEYQDVSKRFSERTVALRKLLEAKDAGVRSLIYKEPE